MNVETEVRKEFLGVADVRTLTGYGRNQAYEIMHAMPRLPGRTLRVRRVDFDRWMEANLVLPGDAE